MDFVRIRHPDVDGAAFVSERAYRRLWKAKGWRRRLPADDADTAPAVEPVAALPAVPPPRPTSDTPIADALSAAPPTPSTEES